MRTQRAGLHNKTLLLWGAFGAGFLWPPLFLLFLLLVLQRAKESFTEEYGDLFVYWRGRLQREAAPSAKSGATPGRTLLLKPAPEMV
ncbi:hypothetical protein [Hydrogenimonas sp.]